MTNGISFDGSNAVSGQTKTNRVRHIDGAKSAFSLSKVENPYFLQTKDGIVKYNGTSFKCNFETGALELGDCSNRLDCIRVPLTGGGSLLFNPDSTRGVTNAIGMFSAEDQGRIMRAIQMYNMAKDKLEELDEDENANPEAELADADNASDELAEYDAADEAEPFGEYADAAKDYFVVLKERMADYEIYDVVNRLAG